MSTQPEPARKRLGIILILVISGALSVSLWRSIQELLGTEERFVAAEEEVAALETRNRELQESIESTDTDFVVEQQLRDSLGLAKPGEVVVMLPEEALEERQLPQTEQVAQGEELPNWRKWLELFL